MPSDEEIRRNLDESFKAFESQLDGQEEMRASLASMASIAWEFYTAHREAGFSKKQAMSIMLSWYEFQWAINVEDGEDN